MTFNIDTAELHRSRELEKLAGLVDSIERMRSDQLDMLGMLRLAEIQIGITRRALIAEARAVGWSWRDIGLALGLPGDEAAEKYGPRRGV